jgi:dolichol kinase
VLLLLHLGARSLGLASPSVLILAAIALIATALEQCSSYGIDNLSVPLTTGWLWQHWAGPS